MRAIKSQVVNRLLLLLLIGDLMYSFAQHYQTTLDGDMALIILPSPPWAQVLKDPLALHALVKNEVYAGVNRFVAHWSMERFYKTAPFLLQHFFSPINSVYLASAIAKTGIQAALIYLMSVFASGTYRILNRKFLLAALLITPFFQTFGANNDIGILDASITYSFFYALGTVWLLLFFLPFFRHYFHEKPLQVGIAPILLMIPAAWAVNFNGPLNAAVILLVCPVLALWIAFRARQKPMEGKLQLKAAVAETPGLLICGMIAGLFFAGLSYYAGKFNIENVIQPVMPLKERYARLFSGMLAFFTTRPMLLLVAALAINLFLLNRLKLSSARPINRLALSFLLFSLVFMLLLPLGGYRSYRPLIIRKDSVQPILIGAFILYAITAVHILGPLKGNRKRLYLGFLFVMGLMFTKNDGFERGHNDCERSALAGIAASKEDTVLVRDSCFVMAWGPITDPFESRYNAQLLHYWNVFPKVRYYYQR